MTRVALALLLVAFAAALAGCGQDAAAPPPVARTPVGKAVPCPADAHEQDALDARTVVGLPERRAKAQATRHGCTLVAVVRDGERFSITANVDLRRLQVEVEHGRVTRIVTVG